MQLWRICRRQFARQPLSGRGGLASSGRWHTAPRLVVYASESLALASLELLVHLDPDLLPADLVALLLDVPEAVSMRSITVPELPRSWRRTPAPRALQRLGDAWLDNQETTLLRVPSAIVPTEFNFLLNPQHPDSRRITVARRISFALDSRLLGRR
jgi:RES domain-containing protein